MSRPAVLVMARAPRPGRCKRRLEPLLGDDRCAALQAALVRRAVAWGRAVGEVVVGYDPPDAREELAALAGGGIELLAQEGGDPAGRLGHATAAVLGARGGPLLAVGTDVPRLVTFHAEGALADLADGCDAAVGPALGGGCYLLALARPLPELLALSEGWDGPDGVTRALARAHGAGLEVGMLRAERPLGTPDDARAALADPLFPPDLAALLRPG